jgi:Cof subfamily protein (haloacid dehalogenase superfamily)
MRPTLVALDLDGTLLENPCTIPLGHYDAVQALSAMGIPVILVTGRPLMTTSWVWRELRLTTPVVCFNGTWIGHPDREAQISAPLPQENVRQVLAQLQEFEGAVCAYPDTQRWVMNREIAHTKRWREVYQVEIEVLPQCFTPWHGSSSKLMFVTTPQGMQAVYPQLRSRLSKTHEVVLSQDDRVEILPLGITKAWGLAHVAQLLGVPSADCWAVGDADNDLEMLRWAGHGCAMGQAENHVRQSARHVLPPVQECGLRALPSLIRSFEHAASG